MDRLRAMELFLSISQTRNFSETARRFGISATGVSRMITQIEDELKIKLLLRSTRQVVLTESGQEYARQLEGILSRINDLQGNITAISSAPQGLLRVHSRMMFGLGVLPHLIAGFRRLYPQIHIELTLAEAPVDLRRQQFDIDFRISPPVEAGVKRRILFRSERYLVASPAYLAGKPPLTAPESILEHECLAYHLPGDQTSWMFKEREQVREIAFKPRHVTNNGVALLELARLGEGLALLEDYTVHEDIRQGRLVRVLSDVQVSNSSFDAGMYATILDTAIIPAKIRLFLDFVTEHVAGPEQRFKAHGKAAGRGG
ncbi:LysR family transcriptional regulator [Ramlibacter rhizophilus]|uniref:LysR family transcriptional regulator n=1 Tax=Ramlibacter rhizophilus TaxID=1781167 RepID=A0A4Z0C1U9_9BURK|nr:LysR family transcriptional regulator [Ramlibacter rhizophilus]TFZ04470.1 LysR family transcriptional regulator [Ramlibacter rhizophilus]